MSTTSSLFIFTCLCMHACNSRNLPVFHKGLGEQHFSAKVAEKVVEVRLDSIQQGAKKKDNTSKPDEFKTIHKEMKFVGNGANSGMVNAGSEIVESPSDVGLVKAAKIKVSRLQEEASHSTNLHEGAMDTDYEPPHRKTPIHN